MRRKTVTAKCQISVDALKKVIRGPLKQKRRKKTGKITKRGKKAKRATAKRSTPRKRKRTTGVKRRTGGKTKRRRVKKPAATTTATADE
jgi:hypothetical protein